jgi:hypothetical protein
MSLFWMNVDEIYSRQIRVGMQSFPLTREVLWSRGQILMEVIRGKSVKDYPPQLRRKTLG